MTDIRSDPHYAEGFYDALDGDPLLHDATDAYRAGWEAAWKAKDMLLDAGFTQDGRNFSKTTVIRRDAP